VVVDLIAQHDVEANEQLAGEGDFRLGPSAAMEDREVAPPKIVVRARGEWGGLAKDPAEERVALFRDLAEALLVGRGVDRGRQADVTDDVLAVWKAPGGPRTRTVMSAVSGPTPG
jgi:hypothetical protein